MTNLEIVHNFVEQGSKAQMVAATREFNVSAGKSSTKMLGTYSPVTNLDWAVVVQKPRDEAYSRRVMKCSARRGCWPSWRSF